METIKMFFSNPIVLVAAVCAGIALIFWAVRKSAGREAEGLPKLDYAPKQPGSAEGSGGES